MNNKNLYGLILSGGQSSRMGRDKGLIIYHGKPQREYLFELLKEFCEDVYTSCKKRNELPEQLHPLPDLFDIESPLNGILTAFQHSPDATWLTAPVDMPYIDREGIQFLIDHRDPAAVATCFYDSDGKEPEPLFTIWESQAALELNRFYIEGNISPKKFLITHDIKLLNSPNPKLHININSEEDLNNFFNTHSS